MLLDSLVESATVDLRVTLVKKTIFGYMSFGGRRIRVF